MKREFFLLAVLFFTSYAYSHEVVCEGFVPNNAKAYAGTQWIVIFSKDQKSAKLTSEQFSFTHELPCEAGGLYSWFLEGKLGCEDNNIDLMLLLNTGDLLPGYFVEFNSEMYVRLEQNPKFKGPTLPIKIADLKCEKRPAI